MHHEHKDDHHRFWLFDMPFISTPTKTVYYTGRVRPGGEPPSSTTVSVTSTTDFVLGVDTCGFTTASTITCGFGSECTNVGNFRGCCTPGTGDCASTIYTACINYGEAPDAGQCGLHTLCCSEANPYCFTYAFKTEGEPGATFTHVECDPSPGFGEMFPFPPELITMTSGSPATIATSSSSDTSSHSSVSVGAIVGAAVGGVLFIILVIVAAALVFRRRRRQTAIRDTAAAPPPPDKTPHSSTDASPTTEKDQAQAQAAAAAIAAAGGKQRRRSFLRPLSAIREQPPHAPFPPRTSSRSRRHLSADSATDPRQSFGPEWPLGPGSRNPLGAHPVDADLRKRLSDSRLGAGTRLGGADEELLLLRQQQQQQQQQQSRFGPAPTLLSPSPPPPPPGTRPAPPFPAPRPRKTSGGRTDYSPTSMTALMQSPRLSHVPVSPIERVAFGDGAERRVSRLLGRLNAITVANAHSNVNTDAGAGATTLASTAEPEPVSPIGSDEGGEGGVQDVQRLSYVSAPSVPGERDLDLGDVVSPVSPRLVESDGEDGEADVTVSPLESRRGTPAPYVAGK
ncbi:hypothetical protein GGR54DRAFT_268472 [Hypoxylon sp. NC1633]|nr:hypothetical protein GGR54DRAFT_268472 [Hypoxylon sp. NC1633]